MGPVFASPQINVYAEDVPRSVAFYEQLGFTETFRTPSAGAPIHVEPCLWCDDTDTAYDALLAAGATSMVQARG